MDEPMLVDQEKLISISYVRTLVVVQRPAKGEV